MDKKAKILRIIARLNIGGPAIHAILLTEGLDKSRYDSVLVAGMVDAYENDMMYLAKEKGITPVIIPEFGREISFKDDLIASCKLCKIIIKEKPQIIHTHTAKAGTLGRLAGIFYKLIFGWEKCKLVHTFHGHIFYGYFNKFKTIFFVWVERILAKFTDVIIVVGEKIKEDLLKLKIGSLNKIKVIPLGIELDKLLKLPDSTNHTIKVGIVGRLVSIKNHRMFLDVIRILENENLHQEVKYFIVGDGELREDLQTYARQLDIQDSVMFAGWERDLNNIYANLDIVALTSINEGTPVSLIEAMAAGKPVITTDVGGVSDFVNDERGILVRSGDVDGFAKGLRRLINDKDTREKMGRSGREFARERFDKKRLIKDIENLYNKLLV